MIRRKLRRASLRGCGFAAVVLVIACLASASALAADLPSLLGPSTQSLPQAPALPQAPSLPNLLPQLPSAPAPSPRTAPSLPLPKPPSSLPEAPRPGLPSAPGGSSSPLAGRSEGGSASGSGSGSAAGASPGAPSAAGARGTGALAAATGRSHARQGKRARKLARELRLRRAVGRLRGCFYAISRSERRVLTLRAGLGPAPALSVRTVAQRLGVSNARLLSVERHGLRSLRSADRTDGCGRPALGQQVPSGTVFAKLQAGLLPPLLAGTGESASAAKGRVARDQGAALGASRSSGGQPQPKVAGLGLDSANGSGAADNPLLPAIAAALALLTLLVAVVLFRRRPQRDLAGASGSGDTAQVAPPARVSPPWGLPPYRKSSRPATGQPARARAVPPELPAAPESENGNAPVKPGAVRSALVAFGLGQFLRNRR